MLRKYNDLKESTKQEIKRAFVHWHYDTTVKTFDAWANNKAFYVTKLDTLDKRYNHCEPDFMVEIA